MPNHCRNHLQEALGGAQLPGLAQRSQTWTSPFPSPRAQASNVGWRRRSGGTHSNAKPQRRLPEHAGKNQTIITLSSAPLPPGYGQRDERSPTRHNVTPALRHLVPTRGRTSWGQRSGIQYPAWPDVPWRSGTECPRRDRPGRGPNVPQRSGTECPTRGRSG